LSVCVSPSKIHQGTSRVDKGKVMALPSPKELFKKQVL